MRYSKYAILLLLLLGVFTGYAQTVVVFSTADSGPGTLRAAIQAIPAIRTDPFIINFNLTGDMSTDAYRTIRLKSQLPVIPSNVIIDGSSQMAGGTLGVSGARVIIEPEDVTFLPTFTSCFTIGVNTSTDIQTTDVEIYGLYIKDFARITNVQNANIQASGIIVDARAKNIKIGAPGKGNVISGNQNGIAIRNVTSYYLINPITDINIQSNIIGLHYDGLTAKTNFNGINAIDFREGSITIGGDNPGDGNVISANKINVDIRGTNIGATRFALNIVNNKIGSDMTGTIDFRGTPLLTVPSTVEITGLKIDALNTNLHVRGNVIVGNKTNGLSIANADFVVTGNSIGTGKLGTEMLGNGIGIKIEVGAIGTIGGDTDEKANKIANNDYGIESASARAVTITRNSMYCNKISGIGETRAITQPYVQILIIRPDFLSGKATPNSTIELFYTENCNGICEGKQYIATVPTGSDGRWIYDQGPITGKVTATATLLNQTTSPFATAAVRDQEIIIEPVTCNGKGSINVPEPREGISFQWYQVLDNGTRIDKGTDQKVEDLVEGNYILITDDGCRKMTSELLQIKDQRMTDLIVNWPQEQCGQTSFQFSATVQRGKGTKTFMWIDQNGTTVRTGSSVSLGPGTYKLVVRDEAGCELFEQGREFKLRPIPSILSSIQPRPARCGFPDGEIRGLSIGGSPTGVVTYKWNKYNGSIPPYYGQEVGTQLDLVGVEGGTYRLTIMDEGDCTPIFRDFVIPIIKSVVINLGYQITPTTCNIANGRISNVRVDEADFIQWVGPGGVVLEERGYSPGEALELKDRAPGTYTLNAKNTITGCTDSRPFRIDQINPTEYRLTERVTDATCGLNNGQISLNFTTVTPVRFEWRDATGMVLPTGTVRELKDLAPGTYRYFTYDANGCSMEFGPFKILPVEILSVDNTAIPPTNDGCSLSRGAVTGLQPRGGIPPYRYSWEDENGLSIRNNQTTPDLTGVPAGRYRMILEDNTSCGKTWSNYYTVENHDFTIESPVAGGVNVCYATEIMIGVLAPDEGKYELYKDIADTAPLLESANGVFVFKVSKTGDYFIRRKLGSCHSDFTSVHIEVTNDNLEIKNTMTPNGDGMNDYWMINGLPDHADTNIKIYTRSGQLVYESVGPYSKPFDGRFRGKELPAGAYYYKIDLRADCKPIAGSITLLR
jgi:gliding motility-associated-like protein